MQQGIKKLQWFEYLKVVFLEILNSALCRVFLQIRSQITAQQKTINTYYTPDWNSLDNKIMSPTDLLLQVLRPLIPYRSFSLIHHN